MSVIHQALDLKPGDRTVSIAIGMFDGVHLGHQRVLRQTVSDAKAGGAVAVAVTFDQHPNAIVAPDRTPRLIYSLPQRLRVLEAAGLDAILLIHFDPSFSQQSGDSFISGLVQDFGRVQSISIGRDFVFGHRRSGNVALLKSLGARLGFAVHDVAAVRWQDKVVSSTRIREEIQEGNLEAANQMLGRPYGIAGRVVAGERLGRKLGFPTANLDVAGLVLPPPGVYAGRVEQGGEVRLAVANLGHRPTLERTEPELRFEVHLPNFNGDLYGQELQFTFLQRLRGEQKFESLEALQAQIVRDIAAAALVPG